MVTSIVCATRAPRLSPQLFFVALACHQAVPNGFGQHLSNIEKKISERRESNPWPLGAKRECFLLLALSNSLTPKLTKLNRPQT